MAPRSLSQDQRLPHQRRSPDSTHTFLSSGARPVVGVCAAGARGPLNATWREFVEKHRAVARTKGGNK